MLVSYQFGYSQGALDAGFVQFLVVVSDQILDQNVAAVLIHGASLLFSIMAKLGFYWFWCFLCFSTIAFLFGLFCIFRFSPDKNVAHGVLGVLIKTTDVLFSLSQVDVSQADEMLVCFLFKVRNIYLSLMLCDKHTRRTSR